MDDIRFYLSVFLRRLHWFLIVALLITGVAVAFAISAPPVYVSQLKLVVEAPQIPEELAASTVQTPALEQLEILEQRLLTRDNLLTIARDLKVFNNVTEMSPDAIVKAMRARTSVKTISGRDRATLTTVSFEAGEPIKAAGVLNEYLNIIQESDAEIRRDRAGGTLEFFRQEVQRLGEEIDEQSAEILAFKQANSDALPESFEFRMNERSSLQDKLLLIQRDIKRLESQRLRLEQLFEATGQAVETGGPTQRVRLSPQEQVLIELETELVGLLATLSEENPKVKVLRARIAQLEAGIAGTAAEEADGEDDTAEATTTAVRNQARATLDIQLSEIDSEIEILTSQIGGLEQQITVLEDAISRTPEVSITLDEMERTQEILTGQYNAAEDRLARALTGDLIEARSRGQRISVIEQPNVPDQPTKPNRQLIAVGGAALGMGAGLALVILLELMNSSLRRPEDLVSRLGVTPFTTIPYMRSRRQIILQRSIRIFFLLLILIGIPAAIYAVHVYYLPIDLLVGRVLDRFGISW